MIEAVQIAYAKEEFPTQFARSLFLAGPTPRSADVQSWRPEALRILINLGYDGVVFVPESSTGYKASYADQVDWEHKALEMSDCILFWIPRNLQVFPGLTTNVEFGLWAHSGKIVLGAPPEAPKMDYLRSLAGKLGIPQAENLEDALKHSLQFVGEGAFRSQGECQVPLHIWKTRSFQAWYKAQVEAGNRLDGARVEWVFRVGPGKSIVYCWALHVSVYVAGENRNKTNELVISRPDISTLVMYKPEANPLQTKIVLIREFRSPAATSDGFIWEVPGGSSFTLADPLEIAVEEAHEETGLRIDAARLNYVGTRQLAGTFSAHKAHVFSVSITDEELAWLSGQVGIPHGNPATHPSGERTYVEIRTMEEILAENLLDWSTIGMVCQALQPAGTPDRM
ncbi:MAG: NUDIX hydrolase [Armatimonadetes bacterium]|nr:NUDIX hydrolase [Armatimonadota bacterium]